MSAAGPRRAVSWGAVLGGLMLADCSAGGTERGIRDVLTSQAAAWNRGDLDEFMRGYWRNEQLTFSSSGETVRGWQATLDRYRRRYAGRESLGRLEFSDLEVRPLGDVAALVLGRWRLDRRNEVLSGSFSLVFQRIGGRWVIVHDHTSRDEPTTRPRDHASHTSGARPDNGIPGPGAE